MRKHLLADFTLVYHLDLEGNVRRHPKLSGTAYNVFGIQLGIGITVAVRSRKHRKSNLLYHRLDKNLRRSEKLDWLTKAKSIVSVAWDHLTPDDLHTWLLPEHVDDFGGFLPIGSKIAKEAREASPATIFRTFSLGVNTARDAVVYSFDRDELANRVERFCDDYNAEVDRYFRKGQGADLDSFLKTDRIKWSETLKRALRAKRYLDFRPERIRAALYRPFTQMYLYYAETVDDRIGHFGEYLPTPQSEQENRILVVSDLGWRSTTPSALCCRTPPDLHLCSSLDGHQCFPFYVYDEDGSNRRENITDWALKQFRTRYKSKKLTKWDIFHYVYGLLHHPGYRTKFADNLKRELPRIPFAPDFGAFADAGRQLAELHLNYESLDPYPLKFVETPDVPLSYAIPDRMRLSPDKTALRVNDSLTLAGLPPEVFGYRLGNRSALEWVIDQYRVSEDARSGIRSDPNRPDDPEFIVRLVGQVVRVSLETVRIVGGLPAAFTS
jgi:predicted helicase